MSDFPATDAVTPLTVSGHGRWGVGNQMRMMGSGTTLGSQNWPVANLAIYTPITLSWSYPVRRVFWANGGTVGGNASIGIYTAEGAALYTSASTVTTPLNAMQFVTPAADLWLPPGPYYIGVAFSGTTGVVTGTVSTAISGRLCGLVEQALGGLPMPSPAATFAQYTRVVAPFVGITRLASGF